MKQEKIFIENLKCHGCANTIKKGVLKLDGISDVEIKVDESSVSFTMDENMQQRENVLKKLFRLGYPEQGNNNIRSKATSYVSCAVGRMTEKV